MITGQQVREARGRKRWLMRELAEAVGVTARTVGAWERGESPIPVTAEARIREVLSVEKVARADEDVITLASASDAQLMTALANRLALRAAVAAAAAQQNEAVGAKPPIPVGEIAWMDRDAAEFTESSESPAPATPSSTRKRSTST